MVDRRERIQTKAGFFWAGVKFMDRRKQRDRILILYSPNRGNGSKRPDIENATGAGGFYGKKTSSGR
jgi:hypothetical protein